MAGLILGKKLMKKTVIIDKAMRSWGPPYVASAVVEMHTMGMPATKRSRDPAPATVRVIVVPAAIMIWQPTPRLVADPGPAEAKAEVTPET